MSSASRVNGVICDHQLHRLSSSDFLLPRYVDASGALRSEPADRVPLVQWPDGSWCHAANRYMRELFDRGLSRYNRGGTLATRAAQISHLLRFCWKRDLQICDLTDEMFSEFVDGLKSDPKTNGSRRSARTVIEIGRTCLELIASAAQHEGEHGAVGPDGRIRAHRRRGRPRFDEDFARGSGAWSHKSFPSASPKNRRSPITAKHIRALETAACSASTSAHQRMRRLVMIRLLEVTGGRRGEIAALQVSSVLEAAAMSYPALRLITLKSGRSDPPERLIPVSHSDLSLVSTYLQIYRDPLLRTLKAQPNSYVLVSDRTGHPLNPGAVTYEIRRLGLIAGIQGSVSPHLFRHRFITKLFIAMIEQHEAESPDQFRRLLIEGETLRRKVAEWSGHRSLSSLDHYIHLAFDELSGVGTRLDVVRTLDAVDGFLAQVEGLSASMRLSLSERHALEQGVQSLRRDLKSGQASGV